jgi:hypothetical protein
MVRNHESRVSRFGVVLGIIVPGFDGLTTGVAQEPPNGRRPGMKILAMDVAKSKTVGYTVGTVTGYVFSVAPAGCHGLLANPCCPK